MKKYKVQIISDATDDILDIYSYVANHDSPAVAEKLLIKLEELCNSLAHLPERGHIPPELERVSVSSYREIHYKAYRIIYQVGAESVYIHCVLDGRRDLEYVLMQRLLS